MTMSEGIPDLLHRARAKRSSESSTASAEVPIKTSKQKIFDSLSTFKHKTYVMEEPTSSYKLAGRELAPLEEAELVSSEVDDGGSLHTPVLDIDMPATLVPSTTPGHFHLYIDCPMTWRQYKRLLKSLAKAGVIEKGYADVSIKRGATQVRLPWVKKPTP